MWLYGEVGSYNILTGTLMGLHMAGMKFMGHGGGWDSAKTRSGNTLLFGFTFLCMLGLASYTANLSSFLLMANLHTGVNSLQGAIDKGMMICTLQPNQQLFEDSYPRTAPLLVPSENWPEMLDNFKNGKCEALLMPTDKLQLMRAGVEPYDKYGKKGNCDLRKVGEVLMAVPVATPINRDLDHAFSYVWSKEKFAGKMKKYKSQRNLPTPECATQDGLRAGATPMGVGDLVGALFFVH